MTSSGSVLLGSASAAMVLAQKVDERGERGKDGDSGDGVGVGQSAPGLRRVGKKWIGEDGDKQKKANKVKGVPK